MVYTSISLLNKNSINKRLEIRNVGATGEKYLKWMSAKS
jgi:hypothetical protein